jgi:hypothetical protein
LLSVQVAQAHRSPQLQGFGRLPAGHVKGPTKTRFNLV